MLPNIFDLRFYSCTLRADPLRDVRVSSGLLRPARQQQSANLAESQRPLGTPRPGSQSLLATFQGQLPTPVSGPSSILGGLLGGRSGQGPIPGTFCSK